MNHHTNDSQQVRIEEIKPTWRVTFCIFWALFWRITVWGTVASLIYVLLAVLILVPAGSVLLKLLFPGNGILPWPPTYAEAERIAKSTLMFPMALTQLLILRTFFKKGIGQYRLALVTNPENKL